MSAVEFVFVFRSLVIRLVDARVSLILSNKSANPIGILQLDCNCIENVDSRDGGQGRTRVQYGGTVNSIVLLPVFFTVRTDPR